MPQSNTHFLLRDNIWVCLTVMKSRIALSCNLIYLGVCRGWNCLKSSTSTFLIHSRHCNAFLPSWFYLAFCIFNIRDLSVLFCFPLQICLLSLSSTHTTIKPLFGRTNFGGGLFVFVSFWAAFLPGFFIKAYEHQKNIGSSSSFASFSCRLLFLPQYNFTKASVKTEAYT